MIEIIVVASGKGGTGKTSFTAGVGAALAELGKRVLVIDSDVGLRNLDIVLGMSDCAVFSFVDVVNGVVPLARAAAKHPGMDHLFMLTAPGAATDVPESGYESLLKQAKEEQYDFVIVDGPAGLAPELKAFASIATRCVVITTPDSAGVRGAERMARTLEQGGFPELQLVVNRIRPRLIRYGLASNIDDAMDTIGLPLLGIVPEDEDVIACGNRGKSILQVKKRGAGRAYRNIARRLSGERPPLMRV